MAASHVELAVSNMDLYPVGLPGQASWRSNLEQLDGYLEDTGFTNFEIHPTTATFADMYNKNQSGEDAEFVSSVVGSFHQTFNRGEGIIGMSAKLGGLYETHESYRRMLDMQAKRQPMPMVVYPSDEFKKNVETYGVSDSHYVVQPAPEVYRDYDAHSDEVLMARMGELLITGLCPDTVHSRRKAADGYRGPAIEDVWADQFASGKVYQMHVAADRLDMVGRDPETAEKSHREYQAFLKSWQSGLKTEMGDMLVTAIREWKRPFSLGQNALRMVVEVPPMPREIRHRKAQHRTFAENLAQLVEHAGAVPITRSR